MKQIHKYARNGIFIQTYKSISSAAAEYGVDESSIRKAAKRKNVSNGFLWSKEKKYNLFSSVEDDKKMPKILLFDIETAPLLASIWQLKTDYIPYSMLEGSRNWWVISWSAKWLFDEEIMHDVVTPKEAIDEDDSRVTKSIWNLINEADIVISHNGINFDHKILNMRWILHGLKPPTPYRVLDTLRVTKSILRLPSYSLNFIAHTFGLGGKLEHEGFSMWRKSLRGEAKSLQNMVDYNDVDVTTLEEIYLIMRPWIKNHPNIGIYLESDQPVCRVCGSENLTILEGHDYTTNLSKYGTLRCECGAINKQRKSKLPLHTRKVLMSGMPQ